ncbi:hypothetical protein QQF64_005826 [Cirrhinus molitorella]|uniref:Uncharacterized protein n=1 Tax=Cirrhinus molitorella TaxID=172907 RepID=A0ABR3MDA3_9TELE
MIVRYRGIFCGQGHKRRVIQNEQGCCHLLDISPAFSLPVRSGDIQRWQGRSQGFSAGQCPRRPDVPNPRLPCCAGGRGSGGWGCGGAGCRRMVRVGPTPTG